MGSDAEASIVLNHWQWTGCESLKNPFQVGPNTLNGGYHGS